MSRGVAMVLVVVVVVVGLAVPGKAVAEKNPDEQLPKTSAWRQRPSSADDPSYDLSEAYNVMAANRVGLGSGPSRGGSSKTSPGGGDPTSLTSSSSSYYEAYPSSSGYGGHASGSGYGYSLNNYVDCSSAIGLLSFLLFVDILRDVVQSLTQPAAGRRRRAFPDKFEELDKEHDLLQFLADGGAEGLVDDLPVLVTPLLDELSVAARTEEAPSSCVARPLCQANAELSRRYGAFGRVIAALLSNVATRALFLDNPARRRHALHASRWGRGNAATWTTCHLAFPCGGLGNGTFSTV